MTSGIRFAVRLTPKGGRDAIGGWERDESGRRFLKARVSAPPEDGKANDALVRLIAKTLRVASSKVQIVSGGASRNKVVEVQGLAALPSGFGAKV